MIDRQDFTWRVPQLIIGRRQQAFFNQKGFALMSSAKDRLKQISGQIEGGGGEVKVTCATYTHSQGHNVAKITFSNPTRLNVASKALLDQLIQICEDLGKDDKLRVVVFTGAPPSSNKAAAFIGGADIQELNQLSTADEARKYIVQVHNACAAIQNIPVPVIARVNGFALGAGLELMASCDLKIATKGSRFGMPEAKIGLPSVVEAALFPSLIGMGRTKRLIYLGENIPAKMAEEWGLIERVVDDVDELDLAVEEWVGIIVKNGPQCIRNQKRLIRKWENGTLEEGIQAGVEALVESYVDGGKEVKEYIKPFLGRKR